MVQTSNQLSTLHSCLAHRRRRHVLSHLKDTEEPQALADLAEYVAGRETDSSASEPDRELVKTVYGSLYHAHVPKLEEAGLVEYEQDDDTVALVEFPGRLLDVQEITSG